MNIVKGASLTKFTMLLVSAGLVGGLSACTTTNTAGLNQAAPVTYKTGHASSTYAAVRLPERGQSPATSLPYTAPTPSPLAVPSSPEPTIPTPEAHQFVDLSDIDRGLYDHMKVGNPYKVAGQTYHPKHNPDYDKIGVASWYGDKFHGKPTANGEKYDKSAMTAAHKTLPLNSYVYVTNLDTGKSIKVRLNDRGPFIDGRVIDLSEAAANAVGIRGKGLGRVRVQYAGAAPASEKAPSYAQKTTPEKHAENAKPKTLRAPAKKTPEAPRITAPKVAEKTAPAYKPLRELGAKPGYAAVPSQKTFSVPDIMGGSSGLGISLPETTGLDAYTMPPIPAPLPESEEDGVVTLTIKGPIHMAKSKTESAEKPRFIPASFTGEK